MALEQLVDHAQTQTLVDFLSMVVAEISLAKDIDGLAQALIAIVDRLVDTEYLSIYFVDDRTGDLVLPYARNFSEEERAAALRTAKDRHPGRVMRTRETLHIPDVVADQQKNSQESRRSFQVKSRLWMPIVYNAASVGAMGLAAMRTHAYSDLHVSVLGFACQIAATTYGSITNEDRLLRKVEFIEQQKEELRRLASPMMEVWHGVLALPLIGTMDAERFTIVAEKLLPAVVEKRAKAVIVDLTGIQSMDADAVAHLVRLHGAISLLGCRCIVSGIRYEIAKQMTDLGGDFDVGATFRTLSQALVFTARNGSDVRARARERC
ncbi:MAG: GAF domain-containing protein [Polyangiaceae bacterium]|nr:GAF domain-containing protein [Polyangiaceae bacterium]